MFGSTKAGHLAHIGMTALLGQIATQEFVPPDPTVIEHYGHLIIQALVAIVTIWATVRKAMQRPETVVQVPVGSLPVVQVPMGTLPGVGLPPAPAASETGVTRGNNGCE